ncbi:MAG: hypothetical protein HY805_00290 [Nitrospirae bacterium]|nr:hypothetical protein [Nitrospirota bacterium]
MGLKEIVSAGDMAKKLSNACLTMNSINNTYKPDYEELLSAIHQSIGAGKTLSTLTDDEVNTFFFKGLGDLQAVADAQVILMEWEKNILALSKSVAVLPANNI